MENKCRLTKKRAPDAATCPASSGQCEAPPLPAIGRNSRRDTNMAMLYECDICGALHPWDWNSDCRDDANRYPDAEDYAERNKVDIHCVEVRPMEDRLAADAGTLEKYA